MAVSDKAVLDNLHLVESATVDGIVFQKMGHGGNVAQVVDGDDVERRTFAIARYTRRPMRPKPLMPTLIAIANPFLGFSIRTELYEAKPPSQRHHRHTVECARLWPPILQKPPARLLETSQPTANPRAAGAKPTATAKKSVFATLASPNSVERPKVAMMNRG